MIKQYFLYLIFTLMLAGVLGCQPPARAPEPHLELGQMITFQGANPDKTYIVLGYREEAESTITRFYRDQDYVVFIYVDGNDEVKQATIHKNAILKN